MIIQKRNLLGTLIVGVVALSIASTAATLIVPAIRLSQLVTNPASSTGVYQPSPAVTYSQQVTNPATSTGVYQPSPAVTYSQQVTNPATSTGVFQPGPAVTYSQQVTNPVTSAGAFLAAPAVTYSPQLANPVTPTGIFLTQPAHDIAASSAYDEYDDDIYVPYRSDTHDQFSWELLKQVLQEEHNNVIFSPFSVKLALALLSEATGNNTQTQNELINTLTDIRVPDNLRGFYKKTLASLKKESPYYTLNLETKLYTDAYIEPQQRYAAMLYNYYSTEIQRLHFEDTHNAAKTINDWCSNVTHGRLQQLITEDNIQSNVMLLVNVIYFNGLWRSEFNQTYQGAFLRTPTQQIKVDYMEQTGHFYYHDSSSLDAKILRLPYKGKKFSMFVLLPKSKAGLDELLRTLENNQLKRMQWMMDDVKVKVTLPKFKFDFNKNLKDTLIRLGIRDIFTDNASLPGLARGADVAGRLKVSNVFQKAGIDVNEKGTEAYAATVVEIENKFGGNSNVEEFNVNRPFIFLIEEETSGNIIFAGKVVEPFV